MGSNQGGGSGISKIFTAGLIDNGMQKGVLYSAQGKAEADQKKLNNSLLKPIETPKVMPTIDAQAVQDSRNNALTQLRARSGRASTLLTNSNTFGG